MTQRSTTITSESEWTEEQSGGDVLIWEEYKEVAGPGAGLFPWLDQPESEKPHVSTCAQGNVGDKTILFTGRQRFKALLEKKRKRRRESLAGITQILDITSIIE